MAVKVLKGERLEKGLARLEAIIQYEKEYEAYAYIHGIDEAERRSPAGPMAVGVVILPKNCRIPYLSDSKEFSEKRRKELSEEVEEKVAAWSAGIVSPAKIDEINVLQVTYEVMRDAVGRLGVTLDVFFNDAATIPGLPMRQVLIIKGNTKSLSITAASILAKVTRDHTMAEYEEMFPGYGFAKHKGHGTAAHIQATRELRPCPTHRRSFIGNFVEQEDE